MNINIQNIAVQVQDVPGLFYIENVFAEAIDDKTIQDLDENAWVSLTTSPNSRCVQHYGYKYNYVTYQINEECDPFPQFLNNYADLLQNICMQLQLIDADYKFNQCIVNNYNPAQGISPHVDVTKYGDVIGCFTIGSGATMLFEKKNIVKEIYVKPNSLYIMSGDARYIWKHSMPSRRSDLLNDEKIHRGRRISITFRNVPN